MNISDKIRDTFKNFSVKNEKLRKKCQLYLSYATELQACGNRWRDVAERNRNFAAINSQIVIFFSDECSQTTYKNINAKFGITLNEENYSRYRSLKSALNPQPLLFLLLPISFLILLGKYKADFSPELLEEVARFYFKDVPPTRNEFEKKLAEIFHTSAFYSAPAKQTSILSQSFDEFTRAGEVFLSEITKEMPADAGQVLRAKADFAALQASFKNLI